MGPNMDVGGVDGLIVKLGHSTYVESGELKVLRDVHQIAI
jgi:hypothetical protein